MKPIDKIVLKLAQLQSSEGAFKKERHFCYIFCGNELRTVRTKAQISLRAVGRHVGCSAVFLSDMERGRRVPTIEWSRTILEAIEVLTPEQRNQVMMRDTK